MSSPKVAKNAPGIQHTKLNESETGIHIDFATSNLKGCCVFVSLAQLVVVIIRVLFSASSKVSFNNLLHTVLLGLFSEGILVGTT